MDNNNYSTTLNEWLRSKTDEEMRELFFNMDLTMKYIHEKGYCVKSFNLDEIKVLNNSPKQIKFDTLLKLPNDFSVDNELIHEDIYNSAFLQVGIYTKCLQYMKPQFLKEHFDNFATFLPEGDVPYYRGIIERGANIYFSDYVLEKRKRDISSMNSQMDSEGSLNNTSNKSLVKSNGHFKADSSNNVVDINNRINDTIYRQLNTKKDAAFIGFMIFPTILVILGIVIAIMVLFGKMS